MTWDHLPKVFANASCFWIVAQVLILPLFQVCSQYHRRGDVCGIVRSFCVLKSVASIPYTGQLIIPGYLMYGRLGSYCY